MILSSYERKQSPYVWVQIRRTPSEPRTFRKTSIRKTDPEKAHKIAVLLNRIEAEMLSKGASDEPRNENGWQWVQGFLKLRYGGKEKAGTLRIYTVHWKHLRLFLRESEIDAPALLSREACFDYVNWRTSQAKEKSGKQPCMNTAIGELKLLGMLMEEAVLRGYALSNTAKKLGLEREQSSQKPELSDEEIAKIYAELKTEPQWMQRSFHFALHTGVRFMETQIARAQVSLGDGSIVIEKPKGGSRRAFAIPIYGAIEPLIKTFMAERSATLYTMTSEERTMRGLIWSKFFKKIGLGHACFHCTRVTFITRGARAGIPQSAMMKMVNHASAEIHRVYQRLAPADALALQARIPIPIDGGAK